MAFGQKKDYVLLTSDQYDSNWYYSFDKKTPKGFFAWLKVTNTIKQDPSTESTEYYIEFNCESKTMSDQVIRINWRGEKPDINNDKMPFQPVPKKHVAYPLLGKHCNK